MENINLFSERLKSLRKLNNLSQIQLGDAVGLSKQAINDIEHGRAKTTLDRVIMFAKFFKVTTDFLLGLSNIANPHPDTSADIPKYHRVRVKQTLVGWVKVEARSDEEAIEIAKQRYLVEGEKLPEMREIQSEYVVESAVQ